MTSISMLSKLYMADVAYNEPSEKKTKKYGSARWQRKKPSQRISNEMCTNLEQIHVLISGLSLFALTQLLNYWAIEAKALMLLQLASKDPNLDFTEGPHLIQSVQERIKWQETFYHSLVPESVIQLSTAFAKDKSGTAKLSIVFQAQPDKYIGSSLALAEGCRSDLT
ncbi:hypothetical protein FRC10_003147 [Ceratobasidium sp. 414]|nr:hypothetical protein FRC10_003147 [Ceratobasidium sp. 414]